MNFLVKLLEANKKWKEFIKELEKTKGPIAVSGLIDVEKVHYLKAISENLKKPMCFITYNEIQAKKLCQDLKNVGFKVHYFPKREIASYDYVTQSKDLAYERIAVLNQMVLLERKNTKTENIRRG